MSPISPPDKPMEVMPRGVLLTIIGVISVTAVYGFVQRSMDYWVPQVDVPIVGEWKAEGKPWRMVFLPNKSVDMDANASSQANSAATSVADASFSGPGVYWLGHNGKVAVKMKSGKVFNVVWRAISPNQFDLIDVDTEGVTTFDRLSGDAPK